MSDTFSPAVLPRSVEDAQCALEQLGLASYLMRQLDAVEPPR